MSVCAACAEPELLATLHRAAFPAQPWPASSFAAQLALPGGLALCVAESAAHDPVGLALLQIVAGEGEILTFGVAPAARRRGLGRALLDAAIVATRHADGARLVLDVAEDNAAARALYAAGGFAEAGRRPRYYARGADAAVDALILSRPV